MSGCAIAGCPRDGTNELPVTMQGFPLTEAWETTVMVCDEDLAALQAGTTAGVSLPSPG